MDENISRCLRYTPGMQFVQHCCLTFTVSYRPEQMFGAISTLRFMSKYIGRSGGGGITPTVRLRNAKVGTGQQLLRTTGATHLEATLWCRHCGRKQGIGWQTLLLTHFRHSRRPGRPLQIRQSRLSCLQRYAKRLNSSQHPYQYCRKP